jgi:hypothetical protein
MRMINDYRGIKNEPNVIFQEIDSKRMKYVACKNIEPGEELITDYGYKYWCGCRTIYQLPVALSMIGNVNENSFVRFEALNGVLKFIETNKLPPELKKKVELALNNVKNNEKFGMYRERISKGIKNVLS